MSEAPLPLRRLGEIADTNTEILSETTPPSFRFRYVDLSAADRGSLRWESVPEFTYATAPSRARRVLRNGDVLFGTVRPNLQSHAFIDFSVNGPLVGSTGFSVIRAKQGLSDSRYLFYVAMGAAVATQANRDAVGSSYPALNDSDVRRFEIPVPPVTEQFKIARILDSLDNAIRQTEATIGKLKQIKQGLLRDLLTRGFDANGELRPPQCEAPHLYKDSPLGFVPREWNVSPLSGVSLSIGDGVHYAVERSTEGVPFLFVSCVRGGEIDWKSAACISTKTLQEISKRARPSKGMILFTVVGSYGHAGHLDNDRQFGFERNIAFVVPNTKVVQSKFLFYYLSSTVTKTQVERLVIGNAQKVLTLSALNGLLTLRPTYEEQSRIFETLDAVTERISMEVEAVNKLTNQKVGLMTDLLTGRVRVTPLLD